MEISKNEKLNKINKILIILLPIFIALSLIIGLIQYFLNNKDSSENGLYSEILTTINFKTLDASFGGDFIFVSAESQTPNIIIEQGLELENLNSGVQIKVPAYTRNLALEISFTNFQQKPMVSENPEQKSYKIDYLINDLTTTHFSFNTRPNAREQIPNIEEKNVEFLLFTFRNPLFVINNVTQNGFLFIGEIVLREVS